MANINFANKYSIAGIDIDGIAKLKDAINAYIKALEKVSDDFDTSKNSEWDTLVKTAIKGSGSEQSAKSYITSICAECKNNITSFKSFVDVLDKVIDNYKKNDSNPCDTIGLPRSGEVKMVYYKPVIYLYPEEVTDVEVKFTKNVDKLLSTYPKYNDGWKVTAHPNGDLYDKDGNYFYTLFWDADDHTGIDLSEGFIIKGEDTASFLNEKLKYMGLNAKEINEFIIYWIEKLEHNKYNYIRFRQTEEVNDFMPLEFNKKPDTLIRILMDFKSMDEKIDIKEQKLYRTERKGFTVVEWGGRNI